MENGGRKQEREKRGREMRLEKSKGGGCREGSGGVYKTDALFMRYQGLLIPVDRCTLGQTQSISGHGF